MIRINLLPITDADRIEDGQKFFATLFMSVVLVFALAYSYQSQMQADFDSLSAGFNALKKEEDVLNEKEKELKRINEELSKIKAEAKRQQDIIDNLSQNQVSPAGMLFKLSNLLSPPKDDNERQNFIQRGWNSNWSSGGVWFEKVSESGRTLKIEGYARSIDDVSELWDRLESQYFFSENLKSTENVKCPIQYQQNLTCVKFFIETKVNYGAGDLKRLQDAQSQPPAQPQ
jgi:Tfp pilus assembly protein PilN